MNGLHFYAWRPFDYEAETGGISDDADLALRRLMDWCFKRGGSIPDNDSQLARLLRWDIEKWKKVRDEVAPFFRKSNGTWHHQYVDAEIRKGQRLQQARSLGAQLTNAQRALSAQSADTERPVSDQSADANRAVITEEKRREAERKGLEADASPVLSSLRSERTSPHAAQKVFWTTVKKLGVENGAAARQLKEVGRVKVEEALAAVERAKPADPTPFFVACCQDRVPIANGNDEPERDRLYYEGPKEPLTDEMRDRILAKMREE